MRHLLMIGISLVLCSGLQARTNDNDSVLNKIANFPNRLFSSINRKTADLDKQIDRQTEKYLQKLARQEARLKKELYKTDSNAAKYLFLSNPEQQYASFVQKVNADSLKQNKLSGGEYLPYADSLHGAVSFLNTNPQLLEGSSKIVPANIQHSVNQIQELQAKMQNAELAKQFIEARKEQIKQYIAMHAQLPSSIQDIYNNYNKQLYYYTQQLNEYKDILNDPDKMLKSALKLLNKLPAFTAFMQKNSFLSGLINTPDDYSMQNALPGMQTRDMLSQLLKAQITDGGAGAASSLSQSLESAQGQLQALKDKVASLGAGGQGADLPTNFKPNTQKSKSLFNRLEFGTNFQTTHGSNYFPTTTDFGLSVGYKVNDKSTIGIGGSYNVGWGKDINHIHISSQGAGLRSFVDVQIKGGLYLTGGYEYNYQKVSYLVSQSYHLSDWQQSGLIGLSKVVSVNSSYFKKTKVQLLWNFLSYQQIPRTQPILFRVGYNF